MKKWMSIVLSVVLCMGIVVLAPWSRCFAAEEEGGETVGPYTIDGKGDDF